MMSLLEFISERYYFISIWIALPAKLAQPISLPYFYSALLFLTGKMPAKGNIGFIVVILVLASSFPNHHLSTNQRFYSEMSHILCVNVPD